MKLIPLFLLALCLSAPAFATDPQDAGFEETDPFAGEPGEEDPFAKPTQPPDPSEEGAPFTEPNPPNDPPAPKPVEPPRQDGDPLDPPQTEPPKEPEPQDDISDDKKLSKEEVMALLEKLNKTGDKSTLVAADLVAWAFQRYGKPTAVVIGGEASAQVGVGYTKGKGRIEFKEGSKEEKIHWNIPTLGFGAEVRGGRVVILVYGATSVENIIGKTYAGAKGSAHAIVGGAIHYLEESTKLGKKDSVRLAHVSLGVGFGATASIEALTITERNCLLGKFLCL